MGGKFLKPEVGGVGEGVISLFRLGVSSLHHGVGWGTFARQGCTWRTL